MRANNDGLTVVRQTGEATWYGLPFWHHPFLIRNVLFEDGRRRTVYLDKDADTFFSWPGRAMVGGRWVKGFVTSEHGEDTTFFANT